MGSVHRKMPFYYDNCNLNGTFALQLDNKLHNLMIMRECNIISFHKICDNFWLLSLC